MKHTIDKATSIFRRYEILRLSKHNKSFIFLFGCLIVGMVCGAISVSSFNMESIYKLDFLFLTDFKERMGQSYIEIFISSFCILSLFAFFLELSALSCWGMIFIPIIIAFKGLGLGLSGGYLYLIYGLKGIAFYILILLPGIFISSVGLTLLSIRCTKFSIKLLRILFAKESQENLWNDLKSHLKNSGYCFVLLAAASILDVCFMAMFSRFFNF